MCMRDRFGLFNHSCNQLALRSSQAFLHPAHRTVSLTVFPSIYASDEPCVLSNIPATDEPYGLPKHCCIRRTVRSLLRSSQALLHPANRAVSLTFLQLTNHKVFPSIAASGEPCGLSNHCPLYTFPSPREATLARNATFA